MKVFQVWEYGIGDHPRHHYRTVSEEKAIGHYLDRTTLTGKPYREHLFEQEVERILICVKDPTFTGSRQEPNYPSVHHVELRRDGVSSEKAGRLVDGEFTAL